MLGFLLATAIFDSRAQSWTDQMAQPLLQKEELEVTYPLDANLYLVYSSKIDCPQKGISYRFSKYTLSGTTLQKDAFESEQDLKKQATHWFELNLEPKQMTTAQMFKNAAGREHTKSHLTHYEMLKEAYAYLKEKNKPAFDLSCSAKLPMLRDITFDLNSIQLKPVDCDSQVCATNSGEFWAELGKNKFSRAFANPQDANDWFDFLVSTLNKSPTSHYERKQTSSALQTTIEKELKDKKIVIKMTSNSKENTVELQLL